MNKLTLLAAAFLAGASLLAVAQQPAAGKRTGTIEDLRSCMDTRSSFDARQASFNERFSAVARNPLRSRSRNRGNYPVLRNGSS